MKKGKCIKLIFIALVLFILVFNMNSVNAFNTDYYKPDDLQKSDARSIFGIGEKVLGLLLNVATVISILTIALIGIKYMYGSIEQKAEYKQSLLPWLIGAVIVFSITRIVELLQLIGSKI